MEKTEMRMKPGDIVRHFKGNPYQRDVVVYRALYGEGGVWVRPMEMFFSPVDREKYPNAEQEYRFERAEETADD